MDFKKLFMQWFLYTDRIWLQFPYGDDESLDGFSYEILESNRKKHWESRRAVYQLHAVGEDFVPVAVDQTDIKELLTINLTSGLARKCV